MSRLEISMVFNDSTKATERCQRKLTDKMPFAVENVGVELGHVALIAQVHVFVIVRPTF